jgi:polysaccharide biosynthesis/export protein
VHQIRGSRTLLEIVSMAGGLRTDAGPVLTVTRLKETGKLPLPTVLSDPTDRYWVAEVNIEAMMSGSHPEYNISVLPNDVISVRRAEMVYVVGDVLRAGGFVLNSKKSISVLQALSLAGGLGRTAAPKGGRIIRPSKQNAQERQEIAVDLKKILSGKAPDMPLYPEDILFVPDSMSKKFAIRTSEAAIQTLSGIMIWKGGAF